MGEEDILSPKHFSDPQLVRLAQWSAGTDLVISICHDPQHGFITHRSFDVGVGVGELWKVAGDVRWVRPVLSCREGLGGHRLIGHGSCNRVTTGYPCTQGPAFHKLQLSPNPCHLYNNRHIITLSQQAFGGFRT